MMIPTDRQEVPLDTEQPPAGADRIKQLEQACDFLAFRLALRAAFLQSAESHFLRAMSVTERVGLRSDVDTACKEIGELLQELARLNLELADARAGTAVASAERALADHNAHAGQIGGAE